MYIYHEKIEFIKLLLWLLLLCPTISFKKSCIISTSAISAKLGVWPDLGYLFYEKDDVNVLFESTESESYLLSSWGYLFLLI